MSLADRVTRPALDANTASFQPGATTSWADEVSSPTGATPVAKQSPSSLGAAQTDGQVELLGGSGMANVDDEGEVEIIYSEQQKSSDPNYGRPVATTWEDLHIPPHLLKGLVGMGFLRPSNIQGRALPHLLLSHTPPNMIGQSRSGTGKTGTFSVALLSRLDLTKPKVPQAMVIAPTRELAKQIVGVIETMGSFFEGQEGLTIHAAVPPDDKDTATPFRGPVQSMVVVGTPGTIDSLIRTRRQLNTSQMKIVVLDEADQMLSAQGHGDSSLRIRRSIPAHTQILLFSATFPDHVNQFAALFCPDPMRLLLRQEELTVEGIKQMYVDCDSQEGRNAQYETLVRLYGLATIGQSIIFVRTRATADKIEMKLTQAGHKVLKLHGGMGAGDRDNALEQFRNGIFKVLVTTNVFSRGIDIQAISMVINYDIPLIRREDGGQETEPDFETYLHRIGRTGRFGRVGLAISFVFDKTTFNALSKIQQYFGIEMAMLDMNDMDGTEKMVKQIIDQSRAKVDTKNT